MKVFPDFRTQGIKRPQRDNNPPGAFILGPSENSTFSYKLQKIRSWVRKFFYKRGIVYG
jgi:hypothetical protein